MRGASLLGGKSGWRVCYASDCGSARTWLLRLDDAELLEMIVARCSRECAGQRRHLRLSEPEEEMRSG